MLRKMTALLFIVATLGGCSSQQAIEVRPTGDNLLSCRQLSSELALTQAYLVEMRRKAGVKTTVTSATEITQTVISGSSSVIPIIGPIVNAVLSLFRRGIRPNKALDAVRAGEARQKHLNALADVKNCNFQRN